MKYRNSFVHFGLLAAILFAPFASAKESEQALLASCQALVKEEGAVAGRLCELYMQGYIAGALSTDFANAQELASLSSTDSEFMQRALRTRVGSRTAVSAPDSFLHFCLPENPDRKNVIEKLRSHLTIDIASSEVLNKQLYSALRVEYPCENTTD